MQSPILKQADRAIIGMAETVTIYSGMKRRTVQARVDTGAAKSSIDIHLAGELGIGPAIKHAMVKSASGGSVRPVVRITLNISGKLITALFTLASRHHLKYDVLIGRNVLKKGQFLIDPLRAGPESEEQS